MVQIDSPRTLHRKRSEQVLWFSNIKERDSMKTFISYIDCSDGSLTEIRSTLFPLDKKMDHFFKGHFEGRPIF